MTTRRNETEAEAWTRMKREARELCEKRFERIFGEPWDDAYGQQFIATIEADVCRPGIGQRVAFSCKGTAQLLRWLNRNRERPSVRDVLEAGGERHGVSEEVVELLTYLSDETAAHDVFRRVFGKRADDSFLRDERARRAWFFAGLPEWKNSSVDPMDAAAVLGVLLKKQNRYTKRMARREAPKTGATILREEKKQCRESAARHARLHDPERGAFVCFPSPADMLKQIKEKMDRASKPDMYGQDHAVPEAWRGPDQLSGAKQHAPTGTSTRS